MRSVYENAFAHFSGNKLDVRARFRSPINFQHNGAAFELLIHELLRARGLNPKPGVLPDGTTPDFMVDLPQGGSAIIEATMLKDGENIYSSEILDFISEIDCPRIELEVRVRGKPNAQVSKKALVAAIKQHLASIDMTELAGPNWTRGRKRFEYAVPGGEVVIISMFDPSGEGGLGVIHMHQHELPNVQEFIEALRQKRKDYPNPGMPYLIAACTAKPFARVDHFEGALFQSLPGKGSDAQGLWAKPSGKTVSGVLACFSFRSSALSNARLTLFTNGEVDHPLADNPLGCTTIACAGEARIVAEGQSLPTLLGYQDDWLDA